MQTQTPKETAAPSRSPWLIVLIVILIVVALGLAAWAIIEWTQTDDLTTATERFDEWITGWNESDPDAITAVFTEDGVYADPNDTANGKDEIYDHAVEHQDGVANAVRVGEGTEPREGVFLFVCEFDSVGGTWGGEIETELDGDLFSRLEWLYVELDS